MKFFLQIMVALITVFNFSSLRAEIPIKKEENGCLLAELVVKNSQNAALVAHYQNILDTHCSGKNPSVEEQCAWLEEHKDSCHKVDVEQISEVESIDLTLDDGTPQDHAIPTPKKKHPKPTCEEYQAWYQQLCVAPPAIPQDPPVPGNKDADAGVTTTPNYALAGGACSLSPAGAPLDAGMVFVLASMIGLLILGRRRS